MNMRTFLLPVASLTAIGLMACGSPQEPEPVQGAMSNALQGAPAWVYDCTVAVDEGTLCAVGSAQGTRNISLARSTAQGRARTELARSLQINIEALQTDYAATVTGGDAYGTAADDEQMVTDVSRQLTEQSLSGTRQRDLWVSADGSTMYVLMALEPEAFSDALSGMTALDAGLRAYIEDNRNRALQELDEALEAQ